MSAQSPPPPHTPCVEEALHDVAGIAEHNLHLDVCCGLGYIMDAASSSQVNTNLAQHSTACAMTSDKQPVLKPWATQYRSCQHHG